MLGIKLYRQLLFTSSVICIIVAQIWVGHVWAQSYRLPPAHENIVGDIFAIHAEPGMTLYSIGRQYGIGYMAMVKANPHVNPQKLKPWTKVIIPGAFVLPEGPREGIVINLPEMRLYYYPKDRLEVMTFPVGIGRPEWVTPIGKTRVVEKIINPEWKVPKSIKAYMASKGVELPDVMPPGKDNPLGEFAMRLGTWSYLIHGTNDPRSIGKRSSSGCIRMFPEHIAELFAQVPVGTPVHIINQPYKVGWYGDEMYVESHPPFNDQGIGYSLHDAWQSAVDKRGVRIGWGQVERMARDYKGYPRFVIRD
ncbi:MAG: L,D-transpeptidase family protein [Gammaproteobacteria bacterium]